MKKLIMALCLIPLCAMAQPKTIVGSWAPTKKACKTDDGPISIAPLAINAHEFSCVFKNVKRNGSTVIWEGTCEDQQGNIKPYAETVMADESNGILKITFAKNKGKFDIMPLVRCN